MDIPRSDIRLRDFWIVLAFFVITMAITLAAFSYSKTKNLRASQSSFAAISEVVEADLRETMAAYGQFLRTSAALMQSGGYVSRTEWLRFVDYSDMEKSYPAIQAVGYNVVLHSDAARATFLADIRANDIADYQIKPEGDRNRYVPVLYLSPLEDNRAALGFDIYSEANRKDAVDRAIATSSIQMTRKITLVQDQSDASAQAGVLALFPIFREPGSALNWNADAGQATGIIVAVFRMGDLLDSILSRVVTNRAENLTLRLYDGPDPLPQNVLYDSAIGDGKLIHQPQFSVLRTFEFYGRTWRYEAGSTAALEAKLGNASPYWVLAAGTLISLLLTLLAAVQAVRTRDSKLAAATLQESHSKVAMLMGEVNHRSKNLLSVIQVIARQTSEGQAPGFADAFSRRLQALSNSQDLLVKSEWKNIELHALVETQLAHFKPLIGKRILLEGPEIGLTAAAAQTIGMGLHELATNAAKYGALSTEEGRVEVNWHLSGDQESDTFEITWTESGGPPVVPPIRRGFGSKVTGQIAKMSLSAQVESNFDPDGFSWRLKSPARKVLDQTGFSETEAA